MANLEFHRLTQPQMFNLIPRYLFEQNKESQFDIDRIYQFGPIVLMTPLAFVYALTDSESKVIKGVMWAEVNVLENVIGVLVLSIDKEYQRKDEGLRNINSDIIKQALDILIDDVNKDLRLKSILGDFQITKVRIQTSKPKPYERLGWKPTNNKQLEINTNDNSN